MAKKGDTKKLGETKTPAVEFSDLPDDTVGLIGKVLADDEDLVSLSRLVRSHRRAQDLFQDTLDDKLLEYVVHGERDKVEKILKANPKLLMKRGDLTDYSGRTFINVTPFEYAMWALDRHMWDIMLNCLPDNKQGNTIREDLFQQYQSLKEGGVQYTLNNQNYREQHYDFVLIDKLQEYSDNYDDWDEKQQASYWKTQVGGAQRMVPVHVANQYCHPMSFGPASFFKEQDLPRNMSISNFVDEDNVNEVNWFPLDASGLGIDFGVVRTEGPVARGIRDWESELDTRGWEPDTQMLRELRDVRNADFIELEQKLSSELGALEHQGLTI